MANPDRIEGRWQRVKDKLTVSAFIAIAPLVIKSSLTKTDIESGDTMSKNSSEMEFFRRGERVGFFKKKGYFKTFVGDGGTLAGTIADHPIFQKVMRMKVGRGLKLTEKLWSVSVRTEKLFLVCMEAKLIMLKMVRGRSWGKQV